MSSKSNGTTLAHIIGLYVPHTIFWSYTVIDMVYICVLYICNFISIDWVHATHIQTPRECYLLQEKFLLSVYHRSGCIAVWGNLLSIPQMWKCIASIGLFLQPKSEKDAVPQGYVKVWAFNKLTTLLTCMCLGWCQQTHGQTLMPSWATTVTAKIPYQVCLPQLQFVHMVVIGVWG